MKALWLDETGAALDLRESPAPEARPSSVVIDVIGVRVPANTPDVLAGKPPYELPVPLIPGPACIGRIRQVGPDVFDLFPGQTVLCNSLLGSGETDGNADEILIGWTGNGTERGRDIQACWHHGSFAEQAIYPRECVIPLPGAEHFDLARLSFVSSLAIADAGLQRGALSAGQSVVVIGATGQLGSAAVLAALARGAGTVGAIGRNGDRLDQLARLSARVVPVVMSGGWGEALQKAMGGAADLVIDLTAHMHDSGPIVTGLKCLRRGGTAVLVGGQRGDLRLPYGWVMRNRITLLGSFMFDRQMVDATWSLVAQGLLDLDPIRAQRFTLEQMDQAIEVASTLGGLDIAALMPNGGR